VKDRIIQPQQRKGKTMSRLTQFKKIPILPVLLAMALVAVAAASAQAGMSDFNGDGHPDYVLSNRFTRQTEIWYLNNNVFIGGRYGPTIPVPWYVGDVADFKSYN
jgi:hypothetical protein